MTEPQHPTLEELRTIDLFDDLDDEQLARWQQVSVIKNLPADTLVAEARDASAGVFCENKNVRDDSAPFFDIIDINLSSCSGTSDAGSRAEMEMNYFGLLRLAQEYGIDAFGQIGVELAGRLRRIEEMLIHDLGRSALEGETAGK